MIRQACSVSLFSLGLTACSNLPDVQRAEQAAATGNLQEAQSQLEELAQFGLVEAQVELGDLYADQDTPAARRKALAWYQKAAEQGSDRAAIRIGKMNAREGDPPEQRAHGARYLRKALEIGRASCRERVRIWAGAGGVRDR